MWVLIEHRLCKSNSNAPMQTDARYVRFLPVRSSSVLIFVWIGSAPNASTHFMSTHKYIKRAPRP